MALEQINEFTQIKGHFIGTKAAIEALSVSEPSYGYATDTHEPGYYDGSAWVWGAGGGASGHVIYEGGSPMPQRSKLNFTGPNVNVTDDSIDDQTQVDFSVGFDDTGTPSDVSTSAAADGTSLYPSRKDHVHYFNTNGWIEKSETWTRTGNHTFTVSGDVTVSYRKGTKVRYKDGGSYEYGVIADSVHAAGTTTVTLITTTDYAMAAATITDKAISYSENPEGFPHWFNFDAAPTGYSSVPSSPTYRWHSQGTLLLVLLNEDNDGTSNATTKTYTLPVAVAASSPSVNWRTHIPLVRNNGVSESNGIYYAASGSTTLNARRENFATWTASGACRTIGATFMYQF